MTAPRVALLAAAVALVVSATDRSYCEAPHPLAVVPDPVTSKLLQVVVLSRHGDRSPLTALPHEHNESNIAWDCTLQVPVRSFAATSNTQAGTTGVFFVNDARSSGLFGDNTSWQGNCEPGQLTQAGADMCARMGAGLREVYVDKYQLLPQTLRPGDEGLLSLRTTDFQRTRESLASLLEGLYPADTRTGVYLPVRMVPYDTDFMHPNSDACPRIGQLLKATTAQGTEWARRLAKIKPLLDRVNAIAGTTGKSGFDHATTADTWGDILHARECHNMHYPCDASGRECVTQDVVDAICAEADWEASHYYNISEEIQRLTAGPFYMEVLQHFIAASRAANGPKYVHFSAHDSTIDYVVAALKQDVGFPPYATTVRFELWQTQDQPAAHAVQVVYNNRVLRPPECSSDMCPLSDFMAMVKSRLTIRNKAVECALK